MEAVIHQLTRPRFLAKVLLYVLGLQLLGAVIFYQERMSFLDAPFILFKIIQDGSLAIMVERYGSFVTQLFPLVALKLGASLKTLMLVYSISFPLFTFVVGLLLYRWRQETVLIGMSSYFLLFYSDAYFWTNNEIHQGIVWFCLSWGVYNLAHQGKSPIILFITSALLLGLSIFTHPLVMAVAAFVAGWLVLSGQWKVRNRSTWIAVFIVLLWLILKYIASTYNWYDSQKFSMISDTPLGDWALILERPLFSLFFTNLGTYYFSAGLFLIAGIYFLGRRQPFVLAYTWIFIGLYVAAISIVVVEFDRFYSESQWMLIACMMVWPIVYIIQERKPFDFVFLSLLFYVAIAHWGIRMINSTSTFQDRLHWHQAQIENFRSSGLQKVILTDLSEVDQHLLQMPWGLPVESFMVSSLDRKQSPVTYIEQSFCTKEADSTHFHNCFDTLAIKLLDTKYFTLDTVQPYRPYPNTRAN